MSTNDLRPLPSQAELKRIFDYDPETGTLFHKRRDDRARNWNSRWGGKRAGTLGEDHGIVCIEYQYFLAHRIIYKWVTGEDPGGLMDHRDCTPSNNRFSNLRVADKAKNSHNRPLQKNNKSGQRGVRWREDRHRWATKIKVNGKNRHLGHFESFEEACEAYRQAAAEIFGEFAHASLL